MPYRVIWDGPYTTVMESDLPPDGVDVFEQFVPAQHAATKYCAEQARLFKARAKQLRAMKVYQARR